MKVGGPGTVYDKVSYQAKIVQHTLAEVRERAAVGLDASEQAAVAADDDSTASEQAAVPADDDLLHNIVMF